jgi:hypothetical protein
MRLIIDCHDGGRLKRGDIVQTNVGNKRERTCLILRVHRVNRIVHSMAEMIPRYQVWCERWWELEADLRMRLFRSAERAGGQRVFLFYRYKRKNKKRDPFLYD